MDLTADELHVVLDNLDRNHMPWKDYDQDSDDPKSTEAGWLALLDSARAKLISQLADENRY